ncbi:MAG: sulfatase-like hydrolase/transferase [Armatimonadota bacterium]|nr:sulfatase-like hydrolase/transferase [Armatimonadota bacterium]
MVKAGQRVSRRDFLKTSLAGTAFLGLNALSTDMQAYNERLPNFIIILADDLGYNDLSCYGSELIHTPRLDRMAAEGMRFTDFHTSAPVCTPTRASLMTGCYPLRVGLPAVINYQSKIGINSEETTIAELLKSRGYATACIGKWHLGWQKQFLPTRHGFDYYYGLPFSNDMAYNDSSVPLIRNKKIIEQPVVQETLTERYTAEAIRFIKENKDKPFFLYLPHTFPHVPLHVSERFSGKSKRGLYGDVVECIDWSTGEILDTISKLGLDKNTLVVFTSDNGPWLAKRDHGGSAFPLRNGKGSTWEGGMRVPCIMRWPGRIPTGATCGELSTVMDFLPTFARLAGVPVPTDRIIDGKDILPLMTGEKDAVSPYEVFYMYRVERLEAIRCGKWKLALPRQEVGTKENIPLSLYNLEEDIGETTDVSAQYPSIVKRLLSYAERAREDLGDSLTGAIGKNRRPPGKVNS